MKNYWLLNKTRSEKTQCKLLAKEIVMNIIVFQNSGHDPMGINFKKIYNKYPKVNVGIRRMLVYIKKEYGIEI